MLSGSFKTNAWTTPSGDAVTLLFEWTATQDITSNKSTISWTLKGSRTSATAYVYAGGFKVVIDGDTEYSKDTNYRIKLYNGTQVASGTKTIAHNENGARSFSVSIQGGIYDYAVNCTGSQTFTLDTIPRKSSLTVATGCLGEAQTLTVDRKHSSFTHTITYVCGSATGTVCTKSSATSISWTPPVELAEQAPQGDSVGITFTIETFNGDTSVGTMSPTPIVCIIPNNNTFVPVLMPTISDAAGHASSFGAFIQGQSKVKVDITTYGAYGAWITSVKTEFEGSTYSGTDVTTNIIKNAGSLPVNITVTDSRGRISTSSTLISVLAYEIPKIAYLTAARCNEDGTLNPSGEYLLAKFSASVHSLNSKNTSVFYVGYKKVSEENHTAVKLDDFNNKYSVTSSYIIPAETASSYTVIFTVADAFGQARTTTTGASAAKVFSLLKKNGKIVGAAVGKIAEHEGYFDFGWKLKASGGGDVVVEQGEKDGWTYRKWDSGVAECWKILEHSTTVATQWGSLYVGNATARQNYPFAFTSKPVEVVSITSGSEMGFLYPERNGNGVNGGYASARYNVCALSAITTAVTYYFNFHVTGKWK